LNKIAEKITLATHLYEKCFLPNAVRFTIQLPEGRQHQRKTKKVVSALKLAQM